MQDITIMILTHNEEANLRYGLESVEGWAKEVVVLDSGSTDKTLDIAKAFDCRIYHRDFDNFSNQRKFLLEKIDLNTEWVFVLDADEYLLPELKKEIATVISNTDLDAFFIKRRFYWMGQWIKRGYYPTWLIRLGRAGKITCDDRPINEHMVCSTDKVGRLKNDFVDYNHKTLRDWIEKHNNYSDREANVLFEKDDTKYSFFASQYERKRWIRKYIWNNLPPVLRPLMYFIYRYFFRLGFLDGKKAFVYHFLHAFIYRCLIDFKYLERKWITEKNTKGK